MLETYSERSAAEKIKELGGKFYKLYPYENGTPDRILLVPCTKIRGPKTIFVEMKKEGKKPTILQLHRHQELYEMGYRVEVCYSWQEVLTIFKWEMR